MMAEAKATRMKNRPLSPHLQIYKPLLTMMMSFLGFVRAKSDGEESGDNLIVQQSRNEAATDQKSVGGKGQGTNNAAATVQFGDGNIAVTQQGGHVSGAFGATPADQIANMTNGSFVGQVGVKNIAQVDQLNGANTQATFQAGFKNNAMIDQKTQVFGTGNGANNAVTAQFGTKNQANVAQSMAVPLALGDNNSFITQIGGYNVVNASQTVGQQAIAGNNTQVALQVGVGNSINVAQATGANTELATRMAAKIAITAITPTTM